MESRPQALKQSARKKSYQIGRGTKIFSLDIQDKFFKAWLKHKSVAAACRAIGFREETIYRQCRKSERFRAQYESTMQQLVFGLEPKMIEFAYGTSTPTHNGQLLSMFGVLKAYNPDRWRENVKMTHGAEGPLATLLSGMASCLPNMNRPPVEQLPALEHKPE